MVLGWFLVRKDAVSLENLADSCDADRQQTEVVPVFTSHTSAHLSGWKKERSWNQQVFDVLMWLFVNFMDDSSNS